MIQLGSRELIRFQVAEFFLRPAAKQLVRYAAAGFVVTQIAALVYSILAARFGVNPFEANLVSTGCGFCLAYVVHDRWSFAGGAAKGAYTKLARFAVTTFLALLVNSFWVWLLVSALHFSPLAPVPMMMFVTPWASFIVNRCWVFRAPPVARKPHAPSELQLN